jgi:HD domain
MDIRLSEIVAALSHALDVTEGQPMGHAERSCLIGLRLADATDLGPERRSSLFYALLLKDAGCSTTSATTAEVFGSDELHVKREGRLIDPTRPAQSLRYLSRTIAPGAPLRTRARHLRALVAMGVDGARQLGAMRCERGANIARAIDLDEDAARAIHELDEHWDGHGYPAGLAGEAISPLARIICLAQAMEVFWQQGGAAAACAVARDRRGTWFDPALVDAVADFEHDRAFWASLHEPDVNVLEPADRVQRADDARLDRVAEAFATIVDAKSPFTASHSAGVALIAEAVATTMGVDAGTCRLLRRAGLLHDVGKLGVSNRILDKPGKLDDEELGGNAPSSRALARDPGLGPGAGRRRAPGGHPSRAPGRQRLPRRPHRRRARPGRPHPAGRRRRRGAQRRAPLSRGARSRRGVVDHGPRRRPQARRRCLCRARGVAAGPRRVVRRRGLTAPADR